MWRPSKGVKGPSYGGAIGAKGAKGPAPVGVYKGKGKSMVQPTIWKPSLGVSKGPIKGPSKGYGKTFSAPIGYGIAASPKGYKGGLMGAKGGADVKGKGKKKGAPPASDPYWSEKAVTENRQEGDGTEYLGKIASYNIRAGWGFVRPDDDVSAFPEDVQAKIAEGIELAEKRGKAVTDADLLYFRKPDLQQGYKAIKDAPVYFQVYTDDKGAGACFIRPAESEEAAETEAAETEDA
mmetsp:Transcript_42331/g.67030  ORF Transcript_42331/g.67030 Transcript_42331/m.67030 type:complete len:236 (-) Transcript_42331:69-776(-)